MDKYVVRTEREKYQKKKDQPRVKELKQTTIFDLKRVVVVEDIKRVTALLQIEDQDADVILEQLDKLAEKIPSREVLEETGLGLKLNKLRKHDDKSVSEKATSLYKKWRMHFKEQQDKPKIEVRTDNDTKKYRSAGRKLIEDILNPHKEATLLAEAIERCVYETNSNAGHPYRRHMRSVVFLLRHNAGIKVKLLDKKVTVPELCKMKSKT